VYTEEKQQQASLLTSITNTKCTKTTQNVGQQRRRKGTNGGTGKKDDGEYQCK
jgi:hypothetical protein